MDENNYYRIRCDTETAWVYDWSTTVPTQCPNNPGHTIDTNSIAIVDAAKSNIVTVGPTEDFLTVKAAVESITDASITNPYRVEVQPGIYPESPFSMKSYVSVVGRGSPWDVCLQTDNANTNFITGASGAVLRNLCIEGPTGTGYAAIYHTEENWTPFFCWDVWVCKGYYGFHSLGTSSTPASLHCVMCAFHYRGTAMNQFMRAGAYSYLAAVNCALASGPPGAADKGFVCDGVSSEMRLYSCVHDKSGGSDGLYVDNGGHGRIVGGLLGGPPDGVHVGPNGTGSRAELHGTVLLATTNDINIEPSDGVVSFSGSADKNKITKHASSTLIANFGDETSGEEGQVVFGELWLGTAAESIPLRDYGMTTYSTGWVSGGAVTRDTGLTVDVAAGTGFINTGTGVKKISWSAGSIALTASSDQWVYIDSSAVIQKAATEPDIEDVILLAAARTSATTVVFLATHCVPADQAINKLYEMTDEAHGPFKVDGLAVTENATDLKLDVASGNFWAGHVRQTVTTGTAISWTYWYRDGSGGWTTVASQDSVNVTNYDDGDGTLGTLTSGYYKKDLLCVAVGDDGIEYHVIYGQAEYSDQSAAAQSANPSMPDISKGHAVCLAGIVVVQGGAAITDIVPVMPMTTNATAYDTLYSGTQATTSLSSFQDAFAGSSLSPPSDGDYFILFESEVSGTSANAESEIAIGKNGTTSAITGSERFVQGNGQNKIPTLATVVAISLTTSDTIHGIFRHSAGSGDSVLDRRRISMFKVTSGGS